MRISTQMMYEQNMRGITDSQSRWLSYGEQMSTGKRVNRPSDDLSRLHSLLCCHSLSLKTASLR